MNGNLSWMMKVFVFVFNYDIGCIGNGSYEGMFLGKIYVKGNCVVNNGKLVVI